MQNEKRSGDYEEPERAEAADGSLAASSTATGAPTSLGEVHDVDELPDAEASVADPDSLIRGNRVATAEDME